MGTITGFAKSRKLSQVCGFFHFRSSDAFNTPATEPPPLPSFTALAENSRSAEKTGIALSMEKETRFFQIKMNFLEENTQILIDRMPATPYDFVLAAEHAAIAKSSSSN
ncbi:hypothetical protein, partial [Janthinobacterium sp. S3T4]|uniref:hypothetical protein n=1 Tax=Janthinobacterium sp. S3T4 TaxID=2723079 RepID=UPI00160BD822